MDPSEYGLSNADFGLPPENDGAPATDSAAMFALASQGAAIEQQMRAGVRAPAAVPVPGPQPVQHPVYAQAPAVDNALNAIERRLNLAGYYRALLEQPIFETDDEDALLVEDEIRAFIFERLSDLLGTSKPKPQPAPPPQVKLPFNPQQVQALTAIADALLAKKQAAAAPPAPAPAPAAPVAQPVRRAAPQPPPPAPAAEEQGEEQPQEQDEPQEQPQEEAAPPPPPPPPAPAVRGAPRVRANRGPRQAMVAPVAVAQQPAMAQPAPSQPQGPVVPRPARRGAPRAAPRAIVPPPPVERDPGRRAEAEGRALVYVDENGQPPVLPLAMPTGAAMTAITAAKASETAASIARSGGIVHRE
jgi:hypothetical protein